MNEMPEQERLLRNLHDAGCDEAATKRYLQLQKEGKWQEQIRLLSAQRLSLLDQIHVSQHMVDCLDYLVYEIKKQENRVYRRNNYEHDIQL